MKIIKIGVAAFLMSITANGVFASKPLEGIVSTDAPTSKPISVLEAKKSAKTGQSIFVEGRIKDFISGIAGFTIIDNSLKSCSDKGENCPTPWDYCCEPKSNITKHTATVLVVEQPGEKKPAKGNLKDIKGLDNLKNVGVQGIAQTDKAGNLVIFTEKINILKK
jgi:hypothetical protein